MSFIARLYQQSKGKGIFYLETEDVTGKAAWYYIKVPSVKSAAFKKAIHEGTQLTDWGDVLYYGYGNQSPLKVRQLVQQKYGFDHKDAA